MSGFFVCIDDIPNEKLEFLGFYKTREDENFEVWRDVRGDDQIIARKRPKMLFVEDMNDALLLGGKQIIPDPVDDSN